jgi:IS30 family transposase
LTGKYNPEQAQDLAFTRQTSKAKLSINEALRSYVFQGLEQTWSPEAISGSMRANRLPFYACSQTIYEYLQNHTKRHLLPRRGKRYRCRLKHPSDIYNDAISIHKRPKTIDKRLRYGDWEGDLIVSRKGIKSNITVLVERKSRFVMSIKNENKSPISVLSGISELLEDLPIKAKRSITLDRGKEFMMPIYFERSLGIKAYYCDGHSPWQKGGVENMNARIRRFVPKRSNLEYISEEYLEKVIALINNTPRKCLGFKTPRQVWNNFLAKCCT